MTEERTEEAVVESPDATETQERPAVSLEEAQAKSGIKEEATNEDAIEQDAHI
jgi:hypothetical protein